MAMVDDTVDEAPPWTPIDPAPEPVTDPAAPRSTPRTRRDDVEPPATAALDYMREQNRRARRRRKIAGTALTVLIISSGVASVWGWPMVIAGLGAVGGGGGLAYVAGKGNRADRERRRGGRPERGESRRRAPRGGGAGWTPGASASGRSRLFGRNRPIGAGAGGGGLGGGRARVGSAGGTRSRNPLSGLLSGSGRRPAGGGAGGGGLGGALRKAAAGGRKTSPGSSTGARSGALPKSQAPAKTRGGAHRAAGSRGLGLGLGSSRARSGPPTGGGRSRGSLLGGNRRGGGGPHLPRKTTDGKRSTTRRNTGSSSPTQPRSARTVSGHARQAKRSAVRHAKRQLGQQIAGHNAQARMRRPQQRVDERIARQQGRWQVRAQIRQQRNRAKIQRQTEARQQRERRRAARQHRRQVRRHNRGMIRRLHAVRARHHYRRYLPRALRRGGHNTARAAKFVGKRVLWPVTRTTAKITYRVVRIPLWVPYHRGLRPLARRLSRTKTALYLAIMFNQLWQKHAPSWARKLPPASRTRAKAIWRNVLGTFAVFMQALVRNAKKQTPPVPAPPPIPAQPQPQPSPQPQPNPPPQPQPSPQPPPQPTPQKVTGRAKVRPPRPAPKPAPTGKQQPAVKKKPVPTPVRHGPSSRNGTRPAVPVRPARRTPKGKIPVAQATQPAVSADDVTHPAMIAVLEAMQEKIAQYEIPENGVLDVDSFIASIGPFMAGIGEAFMGLCNGMFSQSPVHATVVEMLNEFAGATSNMASDAVEVHQQWQTNPDNEHDLRRARGEITGAELFNV